MNMYDYYSDPKIPMFSTDRFAFIGRQEGVSASPRTRLINSKGVNIGGNYLVNCSISGTGMRSFNNGTFCKRNRQVNVSVRLTPAVIINLSVRSIVLRHIYRAAIYYLLIN